MLFFSFCISFCLVVCFCFVFYFVGLFVFLLVFICSFFSILSCLCGFIREGGGNSYDLRSTTDFFLCVCSQLTGIIGEKKDGEKKMEISSISFEKKQWLKKHRKEEENFLIECESLRRFHDM